MIQFQKIVFFLNQIKGKDIWQVSTLAKMFHFCLLDALIVEYGALQWEKCLERFLLKHQVVFLHSFTENLPNKWPL